MKKVVAKVGPEKVVHVVIDNAYAMKAVHCLDLILEDLTTKIGAVIESKEDLLLYIQIRLGCQLYEKVHQRLGYCPRWHNKVCH